MLYMLEKRLLKVIRLKSSDINLLTLLTDLDISMSDSTIVVLGNPLAACSHKSVYSINNLQ